MKNFHVLSRRSFLDRSTKIGLGVALATLTDIPLIVKRALASGNIGLNGKKLLFIFLRGANDGLNSVIPVMDPSYLTSRPVTAGSTPGLGIPFDSVESAKTNLDCPFVTTGSNPTFPATDQAIPLYNGFAALHPSLRFLAPAYNAGDLALAHRVAYPNQSRSHFDSQNYWENAAPNNNTVIDGIFYRTMIQSGLTSVNTLTGVSIQSALPYSLQGSAAAMTNLVDPNRYNLTGIPNNAAGNTKADNSLLAADQFSFPAKLDRELLNLQYKNLTDTLSIFAGINFTETGNTYTDGAVTGTNFAGDTSPNTDGDAPYFLFPTSNAKNGGANIGRTNITSKYVVDTGAYQLFTNLKAAALVLNNTDAIVAGTETGSFDTHQVQGAVTGTHANLLRRIGWAMYALRKYFLLYGKGGSRASVSSPPQVGWNDVIVVTLSEFGRTTIQNASIGTDHAEAGVMFIAGGAVQGRNKSGIISGVYGCSPGDAYNGNTIPWVTGGSGTMFGASGRYLKRAIDYRSVLGKLIRDHLGATQTQLNQIIPGYANPAESLLSGGTGLDGAPIFGEVPII
jgi:uncharacterized protein (DUF1501 family)